MHDRRDLIAIARDAAERAYAPYSRFRVGAVAVTPEGKHYTGANIENSAYPSSTCAEATAISTAVAAGARKIDAVAVACIDARTASEAYPCGRCRQIMSEFAVDEVFVSAGPGSKINAHTLDDLLPFRFKL